MFDGLPEALEKWGNMQTFFLERSLLEVSFLAKNGLLRFWTIKLPRISSNSYRPNIDFFTQKSFPQALQISKEEKHSKLFQKISMYNPLGFFFWVTIFALDLKRSGGGRVDEVNLHNAEKEELIARRRC